MVFEYATNFCLKRSVEVTMYKWVFELQWENVFLSKMDLFHHALRATDLMPKIEVTKQSQSCLFSIALRTLSAIGCHIYQRDSSHLFLNDRCMNRLGWNFVRYMIFSLPCFCFLSYYCDSAWDQLRNLNMAGFKNLHCTSILIQHKGMLTTWTPTHIF